MIVINYAGRAMTLTDYQRVLIYPDPSQGHTLLVIFTDAVSMTS